MAATGLQANWDEVKFNNITINRVNSVRFSQGGSLETYKGDDDRYPTAAANLTNRPTATVASGDIAGLNGFSKGQQATFTATHLDLLKATGGAIVWVMAGATIENIDSEGNHGAIGSGTMTLIGVSSDGQTNPISFTRV